MQRSRGRSRAGAGVRRADTVPRRATLRPGRMATHRRPGAELPARQLLPRYGAREAIRKERACTARDARPRRPPREAVRSSCSASETLRRGPTYREASLGAMLAAAMAPCAADLGELDIDGAARPRRNLRDELVECRKQSHALLIAEAVGARLIVLDGFAH